MIFTRYSDVSRCKLGDVFHLLLVIDAVALLRAQITHRYLERTEYGGEREGDGGDLCRLVRLFLPIVDAVSLPEAGGLEKESSFEEMMSCSASHLVLSCCSGGGGRLSRRGRRADWRWRRPPALALGKWCLTSFTSVKS